MAAKRVLIFSLVYYPRFIGGAEIAVKEITDRIDPGDIEFHMVTLRAYADLPKEEKIGNVTVHRIAYNKYLFLVLAPFKAASLHRTLHFDFTWSVMAYVAGFPGLFFKLFHMDVPFVLTLQEGDPIDYIARKTRFVSKIFRMIFTHADRIQAISRYLADFGASVAAAGKKPLRSEPLVIPNGVDVEKFSRFVPQAEIEAIQAEIGKKPGDVFLVTASRLVEKNGVGDIIASLAFLPSHAKLLILGSGDLESALRARARELKLEERVFWKGFVPHEALPAYLQACDIFIRPSLSEGFGNSFIEAMAAGLPVIATPVGGIVDFLRNKETGLFCDVSSPEDIARKVLIYMQDASLRAEIVDNAKHMVVDRYDWKTIAKDMQEKVFEPAMIKP